MDPHQPNTRPGPVGAARALFPLGMAGITPGAQQLLNSLAQSPLALLRRHQCGDWAHFDEHDQEANRLAVQEGGRVFSTFSVNESRKVYVITEADRSSTTILLPEEY